MISVVQLGLVEYGEGLLLQQKLVALRKAGEIGDVLLLLEHPPVITFGRNAKATNILASPEALAARGVQVFECDRGGDVTFHGRGQLVGYPIFDLRTHESIPHDAVWSGRPRPLTSANASPARKTLGAVDYVRRLEEMLIRTSGDFGIPTKRIAGLTGVWTENGNDNDSVGTGDVARSGESKTRPAPKSYPESKIAALGVHISRSVTSHGFALNVNTDLSYFNLIVPCGITAKPVTSMQKELGREVDLNQVAESVSRNFGRVFGSQMLWVETIDALLGHSVGVPMKVPEGLRQVRGEEELFLG